MEKLVHIALTNGLLALLLALFLAFVAIPFRRRPAVVHGLWILVLVKFLVPSFYPIEIPCWRNSPESSLSLKLVDEKEHLAPNIFGEDVSNSSEAPSRDPSPLATLSSPLVELEPEKLDPKAVCPPPASSSVAWNLSWEHLVGVVWLAGSLTWLVVAGIRMFRFRRILSLAQRVDLGVQDRVRELAQRIGLSICPEVSLVAAPIAPLLWALGRFPQLLIPRLLWERLSNEQRDTLLVHELAHLRRGDHWVRRLELVVLIIYWWHPVVWWALRRLREAEEECCDAWVLWALPNAGHSYAVALVETLEFLSRSRPVLPLGASGIEPLRYLKRRIAMIVQGQTPRAMPRWAFWGVVGSGLLLLPLMPIPAQQTGSPQGDEEEQIQPPSRNPPPPAAEFDPSTPPPIQVDRAEQIMAARDLLELMEAKVLIKRAEVEEMNLRIRQAQRNLSRLEELYKKGVLQESELNKARNEAELLPTQMPIKKAELAEAEILLKQSHRRLARLEGGAESPTGGGAAMGGMRPAGKEPMTGAGSATGKSGMMGSGGMRSSTVGAGAPPGAGEGPPAGMQPAGKGSMGGLGGHPAGKGLGGGPVGGPRMMGGAGMSPGSNTGPKGGMAGQGMLGPSLGSKGMMGGMGMPGASSAPKAMMAGGDLPRTADQELSDEVQGMVLEADPKTRLATISIGTDSGIKSGAKLDVYRLKPNPKYLGKIEILEAQARRAVGRLAEAARWSPLGEKVEKGDLVTGKVTSRAEEISAGSSETGLASGGIVESKSKIQVLEDKVDKLMKQIDALREELRQRRGKPSGAPPQNNN